MKKCPYCAEEIQDDARKCKHCSEWLKEESATTVGIPFVEIVEVAESEPARVLIKRLPWPPRKMINFESAIWVGWILTAFFTLLNPQGPAFRLLNGVSASSEEWTMLIIDLIRSFLFIQLIYHVRHPSEEIDDWKPIGSWGYAWRGVITSTVGLFVTALMLYVFPVLHSQGSPLSAYLSIQIPYLVSATFTVWLLFSLNRKAQVRDIIAAVRGY